MLGFWSICFSSEVLDFVFILKSELCGPCSCAKRSSVSDSEPMIQESKHPIWIRGWWLTRFRTVFLDHFPSFSDALSIHFWTMKCSMLELLSATEEQVNYFVVFYVFFLLGNDFSKSNCLLQYLQIRSLEQLIFFAFSLCKRIKYIPVISLQSLFMFVAHKPDASILRGSSWNTR